jgi:hypothetical protein
VITGVVVGILVSLPDAFGLKVYGGIRGLGLAWCSVLWWA